jgi:hypothetical protein
MAPNHGTTQSSTYDSWTDCLEKSEREEEEEEEEEESNGLR